MPSRPNADRDQLELDLGVEGADVGHGTTSTERVCPVCGAALGDRRRDALYCGGPCRAEASRVRRLREGGPVDGYRDLGAYAGRHKRTQLGPTGLPDPYMGASGG